MRAPDDIVRGRRRRGAVAVLMTICLTLLIGLMAFVLDGGMLLAQRRRAQTVADAAAHAAACSLYSNYSTNLGLDPLGTAKATALANASANGFTNDGTTSKVTVNIPPQSGQFLGQAGYAELIVQYYQTRFFSSIWGSGNLTVYARAVARGTYASASDDGVILLNPSAAGALTVAGSANLTTSAGIQVDSSNAGAVSATNAGYAKGSTINMVGNYSTSSGGYLSGTISTAASSVSDPLSTLAAPSTTGLTTQGAIPTYGTFTIQPGIYNGGLTFGGGSSVTMSPGIYYMNGGGFNVANGVTITGTGVTIYVVGSGAFSFQGGGKINLSAPTTGAYAGIVMYQDKSDSNTIQIANGTTNTITGTIYAPSAAVNLAGGSASQVGSQIIASTMNLSNNASVSVNWSAGTVARTRSIAVVE